MSDEEPATRTRLPRPTTSPEGPEPRRNPILSGIGVVVVIAVVIVSLLFAANRSDDGDKGGADDTAKSSSAAPETPAGGPPLSAAQVPERTESGVPVGYPQTAEGAQSAAANFVVAYGSARMFRAQPRTAIITTITDPAVRDGLLARADQAFRAQTTVFGLQPDGTAPKGRAFVCRAVPMGTKSIAYTPASATVEVWSVGVVGLAGADSTKPVAEAWNTTTMRLSWVNGDWKLTEFSQKEGPTPVSGLQDPSGANDIAKADGEFGELRHAR
ncbi:hypothetical protein B4N89_13145 [Embleya scabrispora]|uniref:DUF8175 domain-containing protein n=1 Tax=Embleya scabrispora TaxID=159449 RepID=A0A1T3NY54_9ACTN|nr:hypothetical protein [Embleya scabrispora]OPC81758.1 hypothetical protein B4N89_13145 [Embleya scabrispora]